MQFALVARPRTGTNFFRSLLNQNHNVYCYNEVLYPAEQSWGFYNWLKVKQINDSRLLLPHCWWNELTPFMRSLHDLMVDAGKEHVGFDLKIAQLATFSEAFRIIAESDMHVLHMQRLHAPAAVISMLRTGATLRAGFKLHGPVQNPIPEIDVDDTMFQRMLVDHRMSEDLARHNFFGPKYTEIFYEDLLHPEGLKYTEDKLSGIFGIDIDLKGRSKLAKQGPEDVGDQITCSASVRAAIAEYDDRVAIRRAEVAAACSR